jgi:SAM-dependent methyltransferase
MTQDFDRFHDSYGDAVQRSIAFSGQDVGFFTDVKADILVDTARRTLADPGTISVLDVGCGVGLTDAAIGGRFGSLSGVDVSEASIRSARATNPAVDYRAYDGRALPYENDTFDAAFAICVVHHVEPPSRRGFVTEVARVVRPGGIAIVIEHNPYNPLTRLAVARCDFDEGVVLSPRRDVERLMASAGLDVVTSSYVLFFPWRIATLRRIEGALGWLPLGAQYLVAGRVPGGSPPAS